MSFKRKDIEALGIEPDKVQILVDWHTETVRALQSQISDLEEKGSKIADVQAELDKVKKDLEAANDKIAAAEKDDYKGKYESVNTELELFKKEVATKEAATIKKTALTEQLKTAGYSDRATRLILRNGFADDVELDDDGKAKNLDDVIKSIQADSDFAGFTPKVSTTTATIDTPPANVGGGKAMTWDDIDKIKDIGERQKAMAENMKALGIPQN